MKPIVLGYLDRYEERGGHRNTFRKKRGPTVNRVRKIQSLMLMAVLIATSLFTGSASAAAQEKTFDCTSIDGLRVLDRTLKMQSDGGGALFDSLSAECQEAYVDAQSVHRVEIVVADPTVQPRQDATMMAAGCTPAWVSAYSYTLLNNVAYRYVFQDYFCFNGSNVTSHSPSQWIDNVDPNYYWRGGSVVSEQWIGTGYWTEVQGRVENCVFKYGCIGNAYPGGWIQTYGSGYWDGNAWAQ